MIQKLAKHIAEKCFIIARDPKGRIVTLEEGPTIWAQKATDKAALTSMARKAGFRVTTPKTLAYRRITRGNVEEKLWLEFVKKLGECLKTAKTVS